MIAGGLRSPVSAIQLWSRKRHSVSVSTCFTYSNMVAETSECFGFNIFPATGARKTNGNNM
jgi:hypothetical protein